MNKQTAWINIKETPHLATTVVKRIITKIDKQAKSKIKKQLGPGYSLKDLFDRIGYRKDLFTNRWYIKP